MMAVITIQYSSRSLQRAAAARAQAQGPAVAGDAMRGLLAFLCTPSVAMASLLLDADFSCAEIGCNASHGITNYSYWRHSTTDSRQSFLSVGPASGGRAGNQLNFSVNYCDSPNPNPKHLGCYRSELALQRSIQDTIVDWKTGFGSSERWFGFSNRLLDFVWESDPPRSLNGPSFQLHGCSGKGPGCTGHSGHPVLNLQVDSTGCAQTNHSCPVWTIGVSAGGKPNPQCSEQYDACWKLGPAALGLAGFDVWNDWQIQWRGSPRAELGYLAVWRNGELVLPKVSVATAYNDTAPPYVKFGVYHSQWKGENSAPSYARHCRIAYGGLKVGDEHSSRAEVSTKQ